MQRLTRRVLQLIVVAGTVASRWGWAQAPADQPVERTDPNSQLAHEQLMAKARAGGIDVYFLGDSITRRWGASDAQYADMLANWRENFFGWKEVNFWFVG
jgi:hypothetical protein